eukprot:Gb_18583 [translate_table: standard]
MPPKEQTVVDERAVRREKRDQAKEQAAARGGQKKEQKNAPRRGESLVGQRPSSSMAQPNLEKETDLENPELIPTLEKAKELIRVEGMDEEVATNSPMTLTPRGKIRSELNEQDGEDPLARHIRLSETSQCSDEFDLVHRKVKNSDNTQYSIYKDKLY